MVIDNYQAPQSDLGEVGPDKGKGGNYLLVSPEADVLIDHVADDVITSISNLVFVGTRIISLKGEECNKSLTAHRVCKVGSNRKKQKFIPASRKSQRLGIQSRGLEFWEGLNRVPQSEPVVNRHRFILTRLRGTGIEKGRPFKPDDRQKKILLNAETMGNAIAMVDTFSRESFKERHWPDRNRL